MVPVYHLTIHAYGSWQEDDPKGFVQRGEGLKRPSTALNTARRKRQTQDAAQFERDCHALLRDELRAVAERFGLELHGVAVTPTHLHVVLSFHSPACECRTSGSAYCVKRCPAYQHGTDFATRFKRNAGMALRKASGRDGVKWFSRGWHLLPVRDREHLERLLREYLPGHREQAGSVWVEKDLEA